jgi:hypothetical protein
MIRIGSRDEREIGIDQAADRLAYLVVSYGLLLAVAWRSFARGESAWDLLALVLLGGVVGGVYRLLNGAVTRTWLAVAALTAAAGLVVAAILAFAGR